MSKRLGPEWRDTGIGGMPGPKPRTWRAWATIRADALIRVEQNKRDLLDKWSDEQIVRVVVTELPKGGKK